MPRQVLWEYTSHTSRSFLEYHLRPLYSISGSVCTYNEWIWPSNTHCRYYRNFNIKIPTILSGNWNMFGKNFLSIFGVSTAYRIKSTYALCKNSNLTGAVNREFILVDGETWHARALWRHRIALNESTRNEISTVQHKPNKEFIKLSIFGQLSLQGDIRTTEWFQSRLNWLKS